jgi:uncharacterized surface protein with fasciclin (FAS1) repeats
MNRINSLAARPVHMLLLLLVGFLPACRKVEIKQLTTEDVNIVDYMKKYPETFSEYLKVLERTNISPYLNAYGTYTCFAPTNDAFKTYLQQTGKTSTDQMDTSALLSLCRLHLIQDTIPTRSFSDGKMPTPTLYGQYLISSVDDGGVTRVNRQANISQANILTGNGYIHVIDRVLQPATLTLAKMVEQNARYSIFTQALKSTGFYDSLNIVNNPDTTRRWLTLLAESDSVLRVAGINSYTDLVRKYNKTGNPRNPEDSLYLYVAYHVLPGIKYVADIVSAPSHPTLAPLNVVTAELSGQLVLINQAIFNGIPEAGIPVDRAASDNSATNGVLHNLSGDIYIKIRTPVGVYWDIADQPEIRKNVSVFRKVGKNMNLTYGLLADITWQYTPAVFSYTSVSSTSADFYYYNDLIAFNLRTPANQNNWIEFTTPLLVKGKYKVWICFRRSNQGAYTQVSFNGNPLSRIVDMNASYPTANSEAVNESQGYKRYMYEAAANNSTSGIAELAGVIDVPTTDRHKLRMTAIKDFGSSGNSVTMDMIQFIPVDMDQQWPRFARDGTIKYQP